MDTNLTHLTIKLDPCEASCLLHDLRKLTDGVPDAVPYNSKLAEMIHILRIYNQKQL